MRETELAKQSSSDHLESVYDFVKPFARFESNFTMVPNVLFDRLMDYCGPSAFVVLMAIYRKTFGWRKYEDRISYSQLMDMTGLAKATIWEVLRFLEGENNPRTGEQDVPEYKLINIRRKGNSLYFSLNRDFVLYLEPSTDTFRTYDEYWEYDPEAVQSSERFNNRTNTGSIIEPISVQNSNIQKTINKRKTPTGVEVDDFLKGMLRIFNEELGKKARRTKAVEKTASELLEMGAKLKHYREGVRRYKEHGQEDIRGPASIKNWVKIILLDEQSEGSVTSGEFWDADGNYHEGS